MAICLRLLSAIAEVKLEDLVLLDPTVPSDGGDLELRAARRHRQEGERIHVLDPRILEPQLQMSNPFRYPPLTFFYLYLLVFCSLFFLQVFF